MESTEPQVVAYSIAACAGPSGEAIARDALARMAHKAGKTLGVVAREIKGNDVLFSAPLIPNA